ncbi:hypothetical protein GHT06_008801 [Daphnia sinensis]|uniref:THAP-type domain-containing protein n=1 Tax=Daphnia sinensis TaxID=1820382 RepID=A0AAD5L1X4_9CRUS|nr:hypothetical protein GHT06_008801 [Daphnia sinensis]
MLPNADSLFLKWKKAAKRGRSDKKLSKKDYICSNHFMEEDIIKGHTDCNGTFHPRKTWCLKEGAIPILSKGCNDMWYNNNNTTASDIEEKLHMGHDITIDMHDASHSSCDFTTEMQDAANTCGDKTVFMQSASAKKENEEQKSLQESVFDLTKAKTPNASWCWLPTSVNAFGEVSPESFKRTCVKFIEVDDEVIYSKSLTVIGKDLFYRSKGVLVNPHFLPRSFVGVSDLEEAIACFDSASLCTGCDPKFGKQLSTMKSIAQGKCNWRLKRCLKVLERGSTCHFCHHLNELLPLKQTAMEKLISRNRKLEANNNAKEKQVQRKEKTIKKLKDEIADLRKDMVRSCHRVLADKLSKLDSQELLVIKTILKKAECKNGKSMRYDPEFLLECILLRIKSKAAYDHLKQQKLLPLPCADTIRKLLSCMTCTFGLNAYALNAIKNFIGKKPRAMRYGSLVWDEMSLAELVNFDAKKLQFEGFVDYGDGGLQLSEHKDELADHALVLIFRPYRYSWIQPIACYATKGACKGELLTKLMARAITVLDQNEAIVKSVVCDGAQSNKTVMKLCGVIGKHDQIVNTFVNQQTPIKVKTFPPSPETDPDAANTSHLKERLVSNSCALSGNEAKYSGKDVTSFAHPTNDGELIYFFIDVPHLLKCVRNHIFNVKEVQLYNTSKIPGTPLSILSKVTKAHLYPTSFEKMNVKLAAQILSNSVVLAISYFTNYEKHVQQREKYLYFNSIDMVDLINKAFDIMNGRSISQSIKKGSNWNLKKAVLEELLEALWETELKYDETGFPPFASQITLHALRMTLFSTIELTNHLLRDEIGYDFRFFGIIRAAGGGQEMPTVRSFLALFRMLSVYYPTREIIRNRANANMLDRFKADNEETKRRRDALKSKLAKEIQFLDYDVANEQSYDKYLEHIVYDLAGYMLHARRKLIGKCDSCWKSLLTNDQLKPDCFYADKFLVLKNKGGLKIPARNMFAVLLQVEKILIKHFESEDAYIHDSFDSVISKVSEMTIHPICCDLHREKLTPSLIYEYIVIRYRFQGKWKKQEETAKADSRRHTQRKMSKISQQALTEVLNATSTQKYKKNGKKILQKDKINENDVTKKTNKNCSSARYI